jgi:gliding motility-associated-like protein
MKICTILLLSIFVARGAKAQENFDSIFCSSTCVNTLSTFGSTVFDSLPFPNYIQWDFGDPAAGIYNHAGVQSPTFTYTVPGKYPVSLTVVNVAGADTVRLYDTITVGTPIAYNFGPDIYLCGKQDTLLQAPVIAGAKYAWNNTPPVDTLDTLRVTVSGVYTVSINGCGVTDSIGVFISTTPQINLGGNHVMCDSDNLVLNASTMNGVYTWALNGTVLPDNTGQLQTVYPGGVYTVSVTVPGCGTYKDTASITYSLPLKPPFSLGPDTLLCPKQVLPLNASIKGATAFAWSTGSTDSLIDVTQPGDYWVFVTYNGQCQVTDSVLVTYRDDQQLDFHDTSICQGSFLVLAADFGQGTYSWTANPPQRNDQNQTGQATYFVYDPGTFTVVAQVGQCVYKDSIKVTFDDSLHVYLPKDTSACNGSDFTLQLKGNADTVTWQDGTQSFSYPIPQPGGTYTAIAKNGCGADTLSCVVTFGECACNLIMPNAFTPNEDGFNDILLPLNYCLMSSYRLDIYDRFGVLVFRSEDPLIGWDGTFHRKPAYPGNYVWMVRYINTGTDKVVVKKGNVVLVR